MTWLHYFIGAHIFAGLIYTAADGRQGQAAFRGLTLRGNLWLRYCGWLGLMLCSLIWLAGKNEGFGLVTGLIVLMTSLCLYVVGGSLKGPARPAMLIGVPLLIIAFGIIGSGGA